ncbi:hypothetical protein LQ764DRAFT_220739 [Zygosaccharomyces rouxii]|nr:hypothetical protein LQ764DRAFT_220739 [Zygosaccharomyces rouxii]
MTELVQQVLESNPALDIEKWDEIANRLNSFFYQEHIWDTPYFFYDGQQSQLAYRDNVLRSYLVGRFEGVADVDKIQSVKSYMQSIKEYFELSLNDSIPEFFLNSELPRDTHRNKFFFYPRYLFMGFMVCFFQGLIWLPIVLLFVQKSFWILSTIITYQCLLLKYYRNGYRFMYPEIDVMQAIKFLAIITKVSSRK